MNELKKKGSIIWFGFRTPNATLRRVLGLDQEHPLEVKTHEVELENPDKTGKEYATLVIHAPRYQAGKSRLIRFFQVAEGPDT
jgi:hypothetical protein